MHVALPRGAMGWSAVCDCGISCSYSLACVRCLEQVIPMNVCVWSLFCYAEVSVLFSFAIILMGKRESWRFYNFLPDVTV